MIRLEAERLDRGMTRADLADVAQVDEDTIAGIETGRRRGRVATLSKLSFALGIPPSQLLMPVVPSEDAA